ncbi:MAG: amylo-alpha-1,6-glucosidase [Syntrophales bacterium]|nr:amylo-alpha-1,6-glucosidase [Syntrophales bacterium]
MMNIALPPWTEPGANESFLKREWLETNGRGGYASSTLLNCHTRKYHGLLVANLASPPGRYVLLSKFEDSLRLRDREIYLSCHQYPGTLFPDEVLLREFILDGYPSFLYTASLPGPGTTAGIKGDTPAGGTIRLRKSVLMIAGEDAVLVHYNLEAAPAGAVLRLRPFLAYRGRHELSRRNPFLRAEVQPAPNGFFMNPYQGMPPLYLQTNRKGRFIEAPAWYENFEYVREQERGYDGHEDLFTPGILEVPIRTGQAILVRAATTPGNTALHRLWQREADGRRTATTEGKVSEPGRIAPPPGPEDSSAGGLAAEDCSCRERLFRAARRFLVTTPAGRPAVIAGYPWFGDWGRDTLIALPGIAFCRGQMEEGAAILDTLGDHERDGLLPNYFTEDGSDPPYNTVDASLWFFWAVQQYLLYGGDPERVRLRFWPVMTRILTHFLDGTRLNIGMDDRGLLHAGDGRDALTWMDAQVGGRPVTPRDGCAVEINALWYNALAFSEQLSHRFGKQDIDLEGMLRKIRQSFQDTFWLESEHYLGDVYAGNRLDRAIRPNQILAVSLPFSPLDPFKWKAVVHTVTDHLLTPCGLRTLSPEDPAYRGVYGGDPAARDGAYHQGTVWPWLLGHFGEATLRVAENRHAARTVLLRHLRSFLQAHLPEAGVGGISEIFSGEAPHRPDGCIDQAWSVGELIRLYDLLARG